MDEERAGTVRVLCFFTALFFLVAGGFLLYHGFNLTSMRSVAGGTLAEAYYQEMGYYGIAFGIACIAMAFGSLMLSAGLSGLLNKRVSMTDKPIASK